MSLAHTRRTGILIRRRFRAMVQSRDTVAPMSDEGGLRALWRGLVRPEIVRTCKECGYFWKMPRYFSKRHASGMPYGPLAGSNMVGEGTSFGGSASVQDVTASNEDLLDEEAAFNHCAKCGSKHFSQKRMWFESKADYEGRE